MNGPTATCPACGRVVNLSPPGEITMIIPVVHAAAYARLVKAAKARGMVGYGELARLADMDPANPDDVKILGLVLDTIADHELAEGRPLLPAVVVGDDSGGHGARFLRHARRKGLQEADDAALHAAQLARVYELWAK